MDPTALVVVDMLISGSVRYLRSEVFSRPAIYAVATDWSTAVLQENVVYLPVYMSPASAENIHYLTPQEQTIFHTALRRSVKVLRSGSAPI
jgi:hypothetical protein